MGAAPGLVLSPRAPSASLWQRVKENVPQSQYSSTMKKNYPLKKKLGRNVEINKKTLSQQINKNYQFKLHKYSYCTGRGPWALRVRWPASRQEYQEKGGQGDHVTIPGIIIVLCMREER